MRSHRRGDPLLNDAPHGTSDPSLQGRVGSTARALIAALALLLVIPASSLVAQAQQQPKEPRSDTESAGRLIKEISEDFSSDPTTSWSVVDDQGRSIALEGLGLDQSRLESLAGQHVTLDAAARTISPSGTADHRRVANGEHDLAVILIDATADGSIPFDRAEVASRMFNNSETINRYFAETSYGKVSFTGDVDDVYGWFAVDIESVADRCIGATTSPWVVDLMESANISVSKYEHILLLFNCDVAAGASSSVGPRIVTIGGEVCDCSTSQVSSTPTRWDTVNYSIAPTIRDNGSVLLTYFESLIGHELGHALGGDHDRLLHCGHISWAPIDTCFNDAIPNSGYRNHFSMLGELRGYSWGLSAAMRHSIGWLDDSRLLRIETSGVYSIGPLATNDPGQPQAAAIVDPHTGEIEYFVELRIPYGFDSDLAHALAGNNAQISTRRADSNGRRQLQLLDGQPDQPGTQLNPTLGPLDYIDDNGNHYAALVGFLPGTGFTDDVGISITIDSIDLVNNQITFAVDIPANVPTPTPTPTITATPLPAPSITPRPTFGPANSTPTSTPTTGSATPTAVVTPDGSAETSSGDANCDGLVTVTDAAFTLEAIVGLRAPIQSCPLDNPATELNGAAADIDSDSRITVTDVAAIVQCAVGSSPCQ